MPVRSVDGAPGVQGAGSGPRLEEASSTGEGVRVVEAEPRQRPVVERLLELYTFEFSFFRPFDVDEDGRYGYRDLELYWTDPLRTPFLIWVGERLAGFALVEKRIDPARAPERWDLAEFFVLPRFRKRGVGQKAIEALWGKLPGTWQVRVLRQNAAACAFWQQVIEGRTAMATHEARSHSQDEVVDGVEWVVYSVRCSPAHPSP